MAASSLAGQTLGKYRVLEPLGSGGMARVYRGYHPQLDRFVAIKVLRSDLVEDETFLGRFRREAQAVANLRHPHIIQVFDFDTQDDIPYMVMELLDGDTLHARLNEYRVRGETMPTGEMVRILLDVLDGLAYAHQEGMIHRDIKPANILLTRRGQVVLADFGIAQIVGGTRHTVSGALLGTLNYMAPEQGLKGVSDARSDLYSLGVVFYEMLTRQPPYDADTPLAILMKHVNDPLPLPRDTEPTIPEPFERIVLKALAKAPEDRYQSAAEMAAALRQAAQESDITPPEYISLPLSFTTPDAPSESVAVYSGPSRAGLKEAAFAAANTTATRDEVWTAQVAVLKEQEAMIGSTGTTTAPGTGAPLVPTVTTPPLTGKGVAGAMATAIAIFIMGNLLLVMLMGATNSNFGHAWPVELLLIAAGFAHIMHKTRVIWLFIPTGFFLGNGFMLMYFNLTDNWHQWSFLWPLEIFLIIGVIWYTINRATQGQTAQWSQAIGGRLRRISLVTSFIFSLMAIFVD
ncbi:MAG TPA: protein kinase [Chloroflexota bacterium]|nr:protein kinase [Chloroflexota bacterium]